MLKKVLTVDDSEMIRTMYRMVLRRFDDCQVVGANNGREALDLLASGGGYDLILLDVNMPVMNGLEFLESYRRQGRSLPAPVIVVSAEGQSEDIKVAMSLGASAYLVKPFKSGNLIELIDTVLSDRDSGSSTASVSFLQHPA